MLSKNMLRFLKIIYFFAVLAFTTNVFANSPEFDDWVKNFKKKALTQGISKTTVEKAFQRVVFLEKLLIYDKRQPEFIEKTDVYVSKRVSGLRIATAKKLLIEKKYLLEKVEKEFGVPKEILLSLWGIETNFGVHKGKVDIISALATLSFDKRRSAYFTNELVILLRLIDKNIIDMNSMYGSWAGAHGNFQFMPSSINNYAIDYDNDGKIDLVNSLEDSFASAANYLSSIGWNKNMPWGSEAIQEKKINKNLFTTDARKLQKEMSYKNWAHLGIKSKQNLPLKNNFRLVRPDGDDGPIYLVSMNYEKLLNWNRSLRFAISIGLFSDILKM
jgi:membrane-bound lytic murein transglycosylase B